jgi:hypothetical protein
MAFVDRSPIMRRTLRRICCGTRLMAVAIGERYRGESGIPNELENGSVALK